MQREIEDVVRMGIVAHIDPHPRVGYFALTQHRHDGVIDGHYVRGSHLLGHQFVQRLDKVGHIAAPDRLRSARDLEPLAREDVFQTVQRKVITKFAGNDGMPQQFTRWTVMPSPPRSGKSLLPRTSRRRRQRRSLRSPRRKWPSHSIT
jgi:hypothetical protein